MYRISEFLKSIQEMLSVMNDKSFANLERLVLEKRNTVHKQMEGLKEIDEFLESGSGDRND